MSWAVGWDSDHGRHRGYGVPAYCDAYAKGCREEIDRGLGWVCVNHGWDEDFDDMNHPIFTCSNHTCADVDEANLPPEHPDWLKHILTDESWQKWRDENPDRVAAARAAMRERGGVMGEERVHEFADQLRQYANHFEKRDWNYTRETGIRHIRMVGDFPSGSRDELRRAAAALRAWIKETP